MITVPGFWRGAGVPSGARVNTFVECGCCGAYHRTDFTGDCREDSERFNELPEGAILAFTCDECGEPIAFNEGGGSIDSAHASSCSLNPRNVEG